MKIGQQEETRLKSFKLYSVDSMTFKLLVP